MDKYAIPVDYQAHLVGIFNDHSDQPIARINIRQGVERRTFSLDMKAEELRDRIAQARATFNDTSHFVKQTLESPYDGYIGVMVKALSQLENSQATDAGTTSLAASRSDGFPPSPA